MKHMKHIITFLLLLGLSSPLTAADLTNSDVIKMITAGLPESVILQTIASASSTQFDTSSDGLIALKKGGASDALIQRILSRPAPPTQATASLPASGPTACKFEAPEFETMVLRADGQLVPMTYLTPSVERNTGGFLANHFSFGIAKVTAKTMLRVNKAKSSLRIHDRQPYLLDIFTPVGFSPENIFVVRLTPQDNARYLQDGSSEANVAGKASSNFLFPDDIRRLKSCPASVFISGNWYPSIALNPPTP